jgi:hypothetical protein
LNGHIKDKNVNINPAIINPVADLSVLKKFLPGRSPQNFLPQNLLPGRFLKNNFL